MSKPGPESPSGEETLAAAPATTNTSKALREELLRDLKTEVKDAVKSAVKESDGKGWKITLVALPVVLTALLGVMFGYWGTQATKAIEQKISESNARLESRLTLTQEFYKRRLDAYQKVYATLLALQAAVTEAQFSKQQTAINEALRKIHAYRTDQALYLSTKLRARLDELWADVATAAANDAGVSRRVSQAIAEVDAIVRADLQVDEIGKI